MIRSDIHICFNETVQSIHGCKTLYIWHVVFTPEQVGIILVWFDHKSHFSAALLQPVIFNWDVDSTAGGQSQHIQSWFIVQLVFYFSEPITRFDKNRWTQQTDFVLNTFHYKPNC